MCRWFAYISDTEPCLLEDVLITPAHSISKQVHEHYLPGLFNNSKTSSMRTTRQEIATRNRLFNSDGLGVAWYTPARSEFHEGATAGSGAESNVITLPALYKTIQPPNNDPNFISICENTSSTCVLSHIRMATSVVTEFNNHPFVFGRHSFMHNGYVAEFISIKREMTHLMHEDAFAHMSGTTDSEAIAALYITNLCDGGAKTNWMKSYPLKDMKAALEKTVQSIFDIQKRHTSNIGPNDLNLATTDGQQLLAFRLRNHASEQPPSLYYSTTAGSRLNQKFPGHPDDEEMGKKGGKTQETRQHGNHVIIASEPSTYVEKEWHLINKNEAVLVSTDAKVQTEAIRINF